MPNNPPVKSQSPHSGGDPGRRTGMGAAESPPVKSSSVTPKPRKVSISAPVGGKTPTSMTLPRAEIDGTHDQQEGTYVEKYRRKYPDRELIFTDKDRAAAAMAMGTKDIKVSLQVKKKREKKQDEPGEREFQIRFTVVEKELRNSNPRRALHFVNKALEYRPKSKECFVARSKCYLMLGQPEAALHDAELALTLDREYMKGVYAKANALYALGDFEHALVYYHRGHNSRPEIEEFRLGIQKAEEVIQNVINSSQAAVSPGLDPRSIERGPVIKLHILNNVSSTNVHIHLDRAEHVRNKSLRHDNPEAATVQRESLSRRSSRHSQTSPPAGEKSPPTGDLQLDIDFLNKLVINPEIRSLNEPENTVIVNNVDEILKFLETRQEFWSQQRPRSMHPKSNRPK